MKLKEFFDWAGTRSDVFFDLMRIYLGLGLFIKAIYFIGNRGYLIQALQRAEDLWFVPAAVAHYVILAHLAGGISLAFGLLTRVGALVQIPPLFGALFYVHLPKVAAVGPRQNVEFSALVLFLLVLIFLRGSGPLSVDSRLLKRDGVASA